MRSNILSKLIFASCDTPIARITGCVSSLRIWVGDSPGKLYSQCSYQGQQGDVSQSVRGNYKTRFWGGRNLTTVEGNASVYQVNPVSRITGEGRAEFNMAYNKVWLAWPKTAVSLLPFQTHHMFHTAEVCFIEMFFSPSATQRTH